MQKPRRKAGFFVEWREEFPAPPVNRAVPTMPFARQHYPV